MRESPPGATLAGVVESRIVCCPYCGETFETGVDASGGSQEAVARVQAKGAIEVGKALESMPELASVQMGPTGLQRGTSIFMFVMCSSI